MRTTLGDYAPGSVYRTWSANAERPYLGFMVESEEILLTDDARDPAGEGLGILRGDVWLLRVRVHHGEEPRVVGGRGSRCTFNHGGRGRWRWLAGWCALWGLQWAQPRGRLLYCRRRIVRVKTKQRVCGRCKRSMVIATRPLRERLCARSKRMQNEARVTT